MTAAKRRFFLISASLSILIAVSGGLLNVALTNMKTAPAKTDQRVPSTAVTTLSAERQMYQEQLIGYGKSRPLTITEVSAAVTGDVLWRSPQLERGNFVDAGEELVRIDDRDLKTAVATATARLAQAKFVLRQNQISHEKLSGLEALSQTELETSTRSHSRIKELMRGAAISEEEFDSSLLQLAQRQRALLDLQRQTQLADPEIERAEAEVAAAEATLDQAQIDLERATVRAPYAGLIEDRMVHLGSRVSPGTQLFRMVDTSQVEIPIALPASEYTAVGPGSKAVLRLHEGGAVVWQGEVARVSPMIDDQNRTFFAYLVVTGSAQHADVPAGAFVVAEIDGTRHEDVFVIPRTALIGDRVYLAPVADSEGKVSVIGSRQPTIRQVLTDVVLLDGGVERGDRIVITNVEKIAEGSRVVVIDVAESPSG